MSGGEHDPLAADDARAATLRDAIHTADPNLRGGQRLDLSVGVNWQARSEALRGHRLALEWGVPVLQDLDGPQLETDWILTLGWQKSF